MGIRYNKVEGNHEREIVLLKSFPCKYGKCAFCNYIEDNSTNEDEINSVNLEVLEEITGEFGILEVINSGSVFELPDETMRGIKKVVIEKKIKVLYFEIYYGYIKKVDEIRKFFMDGNPNDLEIRFRMGMETFDDDFRINVYKKNFKVTERAMELMEKELYSVCLLVCTKGQTKEMIDRDIELGLKHFKSITINIFIDNGTVIERDEELVKWFVEKYRHLTEDKRVELLIDNKDLGVFEQ